MMPPQPPVGFLFLDGQVRIPGGASCSTMALLKIREPASPPNTAIEADSPPQPLLPPPEKPFPDPACLGSAQRFIYKEAREHHV